MIQWCIDLLIDSSTHSFQSCIASLIHWITDSLSHWFIHWIIVSLIRPSLIHWIVADSLVHLLTTSFIHGFTHSLIHRLTKPFMQWFIGSMFHRTSTDWFIDSSVHWFTAVGWFIESLLRRFIDSLTDWHIDSLIHWFAGRWFIKSHCFVVSFMHWISDSLIHCFIDSLVHALSCARRLSFCLISISHTPVPHSLMHLTTSTAQGFCIAKTIGHWFLITIPYFWKFRPGACRALSGIVHVH